MKRAAGLLARGIWHRLAIFGAWLTGVALAYVPIQFAARQYLLGRVQEMLDAAINARLDRLGFLSFESDGTFRVHEIGLVTRAGRPLFHGTVEFRFDRTDDSRFLRRVDLLHPVLEIHREIDGRWSFDGLLKPGPARGPEGPLLPPDGILVRDASLRIVFHGPDRTSLWEWTGAAGRVEETSDRRIRVVGPGDRPEFEADFYGGKLWASFESEPLDRPPGGALRMRIDGARVEQLLATLELPREVRGDLSAYLTLVRSEETSGRVKGSGWAQIRKGDLYRHPVAVRALALFNLSLSDGTIDEADLDLDIRDYYIHIKRLELRSDAVSLFGAGICDLLGDNLYLAVVPRLGRGGSLNPLNLPLAAIGAAVITGSVRDPKVASSELGSVHEAERKIVTEAIAREAGAPRPGVERK